MFSVHSSTLETVFEKFLFSGKNLSRFMRISLYGRANRKNKVAYRNLCGLVWTGPWYKFVVFKSALFFPGFAKSFLHSYSIFLLLYSSFYYHMTGSFAVICLMVASVCEREVAKMSFDSSPPTNGSTPTTAPSGLWSEVDAMKLKIAISLACLIGIIQVI